MPKVVENAIFEMTAKPKSMSMIAGGLLKSDELMTPIPKFVTTTVENLAMKVEHVKKEEQNMNMIPPATTSSDLLE